MARSLVLAVEWEGRHLILRRDERVVQIHMTGYEQQFEALLTEESAAGSKEIRTQGDFGDDFPQILRWLGQVDYIR